MRSIPQSLTLALSPLLAVLAFAAASCGQKGHSGPTFAFVSNTVDPFWNVAAAGARDEAVRLGVNCKVVFPSGSAEDQRQKLEDLGVSGVEGIAVSPVDANGLNDLLNRLAKETHLITHDSDAPESDRACFIGVDNYEAGRTVGKLVKEARPGGAKVAIFIGRLEQQNARARRQGVIDELLDREPDPTRFDEIGTVPRGGAYEVLDTRVDNADLAQAKAGAQDALVAHSDLNCMVGLFAYNAPTCLEALREAGLLGEVTVVAFDEQDATLDGIEAGHIHGTVSQNPYRYGTESMRVLKGLLDGDESVIPGGRFIQVESEVVRQADVAEFRSRLEARRTSGS